jgi:D-threo-aldose 1-dehydrogenase
MGGGPLGNLREAITEAEADATVQAAWDAGVRFFDTAPFYGHTRSEHRIGRNLWDRPRDEYVLTTKVGRVYSRPGQDERFQVGSWPAGLPFRFYWDYSRAGVLRSYEDSLQRLGIPRVDALLVHDLDPGAIGSEEETTHHLDILEREGGFAALEELRDSGAISAVGAGINRVGMIPRFLERFHVDFFIVAMPYTLLNQEALDVELPLCQERGCGVVIGAPFASGILALAAGDAKATYGYRAPDPAMVEKTRGIQNVCARYNVPIGAAALQFPFGHPLVAAVIPGPNTPDQVGANVEWMRVPIPTDLWAELKSEGLIRADAPTPTE